MKYSEKQALNTKKMVNFHETCSLNPAKTSNRTFLEKFSFGLANRQPRGTIASLSQPKTELDFHSPTVGKNLIGLEIKF